MVAKKRKKFGTGIVYSTDPDFKYEFDQTTQSETLTTAQQDLRICLDKKMRGGKKVTLITGFRGSTEDLKSLEKLLKSRCGVGGTSKQNEILIQGDWRDRINSILKELGYKSKIAGR